MSLKLSEEYPGQYDGFSLSDEMTDRLERIDTGFMSKTKPVYRGLSDFFEYAKFYGISKTLDEDRKMFKMRLDRGIDSMVNKLLFGFFGDLNKDNVPVYMRGAW